MKIMAYDRHVTFEKGDSERRYDNVTRSSIRRLQRIIYRMIINQNKIIHVEPLILDSFGWEAYIES